MSDNPIIRCPECGQETENVISDDDGTENLICMNDDCTRIIVAVLGEPEPASYLRSTEPAGVAS